MAKKKSGKKKGGGKLAKMSEEERILYLEQKALQEEEMRKKKEDMLLQFLKVIVFYVSISLLYCRSYCTYFYLCCCVRFMFCLWFQCKWLVFFNTTFGSLASRLLNQVIVCWMLSAFLFGSFVDKYYCLFLTYAYMYFDKMKNKLLYYVCFYFSAL